MSIRIRTVGGVRVALCAVESDPMPGDLYLDDGDHYALAAKFRRDWYGQTNDFPYPVEWAAMDTQKRRDAVTEHSRWQEMPALKPITGRPRKLLLLPDEQAAAVAGEEQGRSEAKPNEQLP